MENHIWLASYPRSGNTLIRTVLNDCFDLVVTSKYDETAGDPELKNLLGLHRGLSSNLIKTHNHPEDEAPAIYIVRDARSCIVSYYHFLRDFTGQNKTIEQIIKGDVDFGSWSKHIRAWSPSHRPNTLLLKFEDIIANLPYTIDIVAGFLKIRPKRKFSKEFSDLHKIHSKFFRSGCNSKNIFEMTDGQLALVYRFHGPLLTTFGYMDSAPVRSSRPEDYGAPQHYQGVTNG